MLTGTIDFSHSIHTYHAYRHYWLQPFYSYLSCLQALLTSAILFIPVMLTGTIDFSHSIHTCHAYRHYWLQPFYSYLSCLQALLTSAILFIPVMLTGAIDFNHSIPCSLTLTLAGRHKVSAMQNLLVSISHTLLIRIKFEVVYILITTNGWGFVKQEK